MPSLKELNRHLQSVKTVGKVTGALRTTSTAKYSRIVRRMVWLKRYTDDLIEIDGFLPLSKGGVPSAEDARLPRCYVLIGSSRGLCGAYNTELFSFAEEVLKDDDNFVVITCNRPAAAYAASHGLKEIAHFDLRDEPRFEECRPLARFAAREYKEGRVRSVSFITQNFINALTQKPGVVQILPGENKDEPLHDAPAANAEAGKDSSEGVWADNGVLVLPDVDSVREELDELLYTSWVYEKVLGAAMAAQAATMMAMRSAYDNASEVSDKLTLEISRKRQAAVTSSVIEIASGLISEDE